LGQGASAAEKKLTWDDEPFYLVSFGIHKSRRYHAKISALYQGLSDIVLSLNAILGAGAFISLIGGKSTIIAQTLIGIVAVGSALDKVLGFAKKAKQHYDRILKNGMRPKRTTRKRLRNDSVSRQTNRL
jgi:hypothetical protein